MESKPFAIRPSLHTQTHALAITSYYFIRQSIGFSSSLALSLFLCPSSSLFLLLFEFCFYLDLVDILKNYLARLFVCELQYHTRAIDFENNERTTEKQNETKQNMVLLVFLFFSFSWCCLSVSSSFAWINIFFYFPFMRLGNTIDMHIPTSHRITKTTATKRLTWQIFDWTILCNKIKTVWLYEWNSSFDQFSRSKYLFKFHSVFNTLKRSYFTYL